MKEIVKIQLPLYTEEVNPWALIYNADRSLQITPPVEQVSKYFDHKKNETKIFMWADIDKEKETLHLSGMRAPWQDW